MSWTIQMTKRDAQKLAYAEKTSPRKLPKAIFVR